MAGRLHARATNCMQTTRSNPPETLQAVCMKPVGAAVNARQPEPATYTPAIELSSRHSVHGRTAQNALFKEPSRYPSGHCKYKWYNSDRYKGSLLPPHTHTGMHGAE